MTKTVPPATESLDSPLTSLRAIGPKLSGLLANLSLQTVGDLVHHYPARYLDLRKHQPIAQLKEGEEVTVLGEVSKVEQPRMRRKGLHLTLVWIGDGTGYLAGAWFNQRHIAQILEVGHTVAFSGKALFRYGRIQMDNPLYEVVREEGEEGVHTGRIIPIHPVTKGLTTRYMRRLVKQALDELPSLPETLPPNLNGDRFPSLGAALRTIHFPVGREEYRSARLRLKYEELLYLQTALALRRDRAESLPGIAHQVPSGLADTFVERLPFTLTGAQQRVIGEIERDMSSEYPMHRLLHGEVGSGKTVVSLRAALIAIDSGYQAAIMAPTEVLAGQHFRSACKLLDGLPVQVELLTGSLTAAERKRTLSRIGSGEAGLTIGTHALIQEAVAFRSLGLAVIDEQHRFGVGQRTALRDKGAAPDTLVMTATPIPRTLALTFYGDLNVSTLDEVPPGRRPVTTQVLGPADRRSAYNQIREEVERGRQAYLICPAVDESERELKAAVQESDRLQRDVFPDLRVDCLHGRMSSEEKNALMTRYAAGDLDILIATTVVEVGVDVPNATVIMIEGAEHFGLSQLHQLRGRVGRGDHPGVCLLVSEGKTDESRERMDAITSLSDGFALAEADLGLRGEGQLFGHRQSGTSDLRLASLPRDLKLLERARADAFALVGADPGLDRAEHRAFRDEVLRRFGRLVEWLSRS